MGLAVPGIVDEDAGRGRDRPRPRLDRTCRSRSIVAERAGLDVAVSHDVRAGALAEGLLGAARGRQAATSCSLRWERRDRRRRWCSAGVPTPARARTRRWSSGGHVDRAPRTDVWLWPTGLPGGVGLGRPHRVPLRADVARTARHDGPGTRPAGRRREPRSPARSSRGDGTNALAVAIANYGGPCWTPRWWSSAAAWPRPGTSCWIRCASGCAYMCASANRPGGAAALGAHAGRKGRRFRAWRLAGVPEREHPAGR